MLVTRPDIEASAVSGWLPDPAQTPRTQRRLRQVFATGLCQQLSTHLWHGGIQIPIYRDFLSHVIRNLLNLQIIKTSFRSLSPYHLCLVDRLGPTSFILSTTDRKFINPLCINLFIHGSGKWSEIFFILFIHSGQQCPGLSVPQLNNGRGRIDTDEDTFRVSDAASMWCMEISWKGTYSFGNFLRVKEFWICTSHRGVIFSVVMSMLFSWLFLPSCDHII